MVLYGDLYRKIKKVGRDYWGNNNIIKKPLS